MSLKVISYIMYYFNFMPYFNLIPSPNIVFKYFLRVKLIELIKEAIELEEYLMLNIDEFLVVKVI